MANWISWIDDSEDAGKTTVAGVVANGPTHGIGTVSYTHLTLPTKRIV